MAKLKSGTTIAGATAWHAGNDGSGSGLDADTLDGQHASAFLTGNQTITLSGDLSGSGTTSINAQIAANVVGANELNVTGNGTTSQYLRSDGDGSFTWATPPDTNTTYSAGSGLSLAGTTFSVAAGGGLTQDTGGLSHDDTSTQASVNNSGATVIQDVTLDTYGHVTGLASKTLTAADLGAITGNQTISLSGDLSGSGTTSINAQIAANVVGANELNVSGNGTTAQYLRSDGDGSFTWATPNDTNTTYTGSNGITLSGTDFRLAGYEIPDSANLDDYRSTGFYTQNSNSDALSGSNYPIALAGILQVINDDYGNGVHATQLYSQYNSTNYYVRTYYNGTWTAWRNLSQDTNTTYSAGSGITLSGTTFWHTDTSTQASVNNSGATVIQDVTLDTYGHVTALGSTALTAATVGALSTSGGTVSGTVTANAFVGDGSGLTNIPGDTIVASSYGTNGYVKYSNGLIIQWGQIYTTTAGYLTTYYPIAFPTAVRSLVMSLNNVTYASSHAAIYNSVFPDTNSYFRTYLSSAIPGKIWYAIGH